MEMRESLAQLLNLGIVEPRRRNTGAQAKNGKARESANNADEPREFEVIHSHLSEPHRGSRSTT